MSKLTFHSLLCRPGGDKTSPSCAPFDRSGRLVSQRSRHPLLSSAASTYRGSTDEKKSLAPTRTRRTISFSYRDITVHAYLITDARRKHVSIRTRARACVCGLVDDVRECIRV